MNSENGVVFAMVDYQKLIDVARQAAAKTHSPYSHFPVGAALLCADGTVFTGCNVENISIGCTICAERTAVVKAVSEGYREFVAVAVVSTKSLFCTPCGVCRQFLSEFAKDMDVVVEGEEGLQIFKLGELLPQAFDQYKPAPD